MDGLHAARDMVRASAGAAVECLVDIALNSDNDEVRRKAANDLIALTGLSGSTTALYGWGVGKTTAAEILEEKAANEAISQMFSMT